LSRDYASTVAWLESQDRRGTCGEAANYGLAGAWVGFDEE